MSGLPTLTVELEDGSGNFTNAITDYVVRRSYTLSRGWSDENDEDNVQPAELKLDLENKSGEFTLGASNFNGITKDKRIRLSLTVGGTTYRRCVCYVTDWPTKWQSALANMAIAGITAVDRFARLNRRKLRSITEHEMLALSPWAIYPLSEDAGATSVGDTSGNNRTPLTLTGTGTAPALGSAVPGPDGVNGATFANGQYFSATAPIGQYASDDFGTLVVHFSSETSPLTTQTLAAWGRTSVQVLSTGIAQAQGNVTQSGGPNVCDGQVHEIVAWTSGVQTKLYVDGVLVADSGVGSGVSLPSTSITVGQGTTGTVWLFGIWTGTLTDPQIAQLSAAGVKGFATDTADQRIARLASYANIAVGDQNLEAGQQPAMAAQQTYGVSVLDAMRDVAVSEGGGLFIQGDGKLALHNKGHRVLKATSAAAATFTADIVDWGDAEFEALNYLFNVATGTRSGGAQQRSENATSKGKYEEWPIDRSKALLPTDELVLNELTWITTMYAEPLARLSSFTLDLLTIQSQATVQAALALELGDHVRITGFPAQAPASSLDLIIEGFKETATEKSWKLTFNTAPAQLFYAWILGDSTYGVLGSTTRLYF